MENLQLIEAELVSLEKFVHENHNSADFSYDDSLSKDALAVVEECFPVPHEEIAVITQILKCIVSIGYMCGSLDEKTLKAWKLCSGLINANGEVLPCDALSSICTILCNYCTEGMDSLSLNSSDQSMINFAEQHQSTMKLLWFFIQINSQLVQHCHKTIENLQIQYTISILYRYLGILWIIEQHTSVFTSLTSKCMECISTTMLLYTELTLFEVLLQVIAIHSKDSYHTCVGISIWSTQVISTYSTKNTEECSTISYNNYIHNLVYVCMTTVQYLSIYHTGILSNTLIQTLLQNLVVALSERIATATNGCEVQYFMVSSFSFFLLLLYII